MRIKGRWNEIDGRWYDWPTDSASYQIWIRQPMLVARTMADLRKDSEYLKDCADYHARRLASMRESRK